MGAFAMVKRERLPVRPPDEKAKPHGFSEESRGVVGVEIYCPLRTVSRVYERDLDANRSARLSNIGKVPPSTLTP